ncbi:unnamed protein product [Blepharisma stoltei]|uniref:P-type Ca(2+) transporter n=1 Tax=Blepharisma stoltei TaxID=1481888 RepID=A0AAU9IVG7_9CILI|nr:unnamed protein product [Blepharisma stoltei]
MSEEQPLFSADFDITTEQLNQFFDIHEIREGASIIKLKTYGGISSLCNSLKTNDKEGLSHVTKQELKDRKKFFGNNKAEVPPTTSLLEIVFEALQDFTIQLLLVAALVSLVLGVLEDPNEGWYEGVSIMVAVLIVVSVSSVQDYLKELQFRKLNSEVKRLKITVIRNGNTEEVFTDKLVVGDLVLLKPGDIAPADGILSRSYGILADESTMTGESKLVKKGDNDPFIISSSIITEGTGEMIVCAVGKNSLMGRNQKLFKNEVLDEQTPLQIKLEKVAKHIGIAGAIASVLIFIFLSIFTVEEAIVDGTWSSDSTSAIISAFIIAITILVVAIPEGLPLAVTLSLAFSMRKMKDENIFVKHLSACETMGGCQELLIDKTGTITKNEMKVVKFRIGGKNVSSKNSKIDENLGMIIANSIARNTTADVHMEDDKLIKTGNRTECAMLMFLKECGYEYHNYRDLDTQAMQLPFSSDSKMMTTLHVDAQENGFLYVKGAPERVIEKCAFYYKEDGIQGELTTEIIESINATIEKWSQKMRRTLALAYKSGTLEALNLGSKPTKEELDASLNGMILIGIIGIEDPIRDEAASALSQLKETGVTVRMITGDCKDIAARIGKQCYLLSPDSEVNKNTVLLGRDFSVKVGGIKVDEDDEKTTYKVGNEEEFKLIAEDLKILARCSPQDKLLITIGMRNLDRVVAVTGDGTNDAPALQRADIGIAMMTATPLAKESADIILLDDNIQNLVIAVKWGRNIFENIRRFLQFQLTVNIVALFLCLLGAVSVASSPLSAVQMLWVNLVMDSLAALALSTQDPDKRVLESHPYGKSEYIISKEMIFSIIVQSTYQIIVLTLVLFLTPTLLGIENGWDDGALHYTIFFNVFVMMQLFNQISCRKIRKDDWNIFDGIGSNWLFGVIIGLEFVMQILFVQFGGSFMNTEELTPITHLCCIAIGISVIPVALFTKFLITKTL